MDRQRNSPGYLAEERLYAALYGAHPAARRSPTADSITALTIEAVRAWHRERYIPENAILSVFGDVESVGEGGEGGIVEWLEDRFGDWSPGAYAPPGIPRLVPPASGAIHLVDRPGSAQTTLLVGNTAIRRDDPDYPVLRLMNDLMGGGPSSRLFRAMNAGGLAVAAFSSFSALAYPGPWVLSVSVRTADTGPALEALFAEIRSIRTEPVPAEELAAAKQSTIRSFALSLEQPESVLSYAVLEEAHGLSGDYWDTYAAVLAGITADDVRGAATRYLDLDAAQVIAVNDATMMLSLLEAYGPVAVYDTQGNLLNDIE
jgi:zinc protease